MKKLGVYIHIPFCKKKCKYCDFLSFEKDKENEYVDALINQIKIFDRKNEYIIDTVFFGGGTPSILSIKNINKIFDSIYKNYKCNFEEVTIELNPDTIQTNKLKEYKRLGVNRLSIGLQSTDNRLLSKLGRVHTYEQFIKGFESARNEGFSNINIDIMAALPEQNIENYRKTLYDIVRINPEHISSYGLIIEENTPFYELYNKYSGKLKHELPDEEVYMAMYEMTGKLFDENGYKRYEISNYAKIGYECKHNLKYWFREDYVGFGLGASSCISDKRYKVGNNFNNYINNVYDVQIEDLEIRDIYNEFIMLSLRTKRGIDLTKVKDITGYDVLENQNLYKFITNNYILKDNKYLYLTEKGMEISSYIISELMI